MIDNTDAIESSSRFPFPSLDEQADLAEKHGADTLLFCPDPWALRHVFINQQTGETIRARCNRWDGLFCVPRKVDQKVTQEALCASMARTRTGFLYFSGNAAQSF